MNMHSTYRRAGAFLVAIDGRFALVDQQLEQVHILNAAGAWVWTRLGTPVAVPAEFRAATAAFVRELERLGLLGDVSGAEAIAPAGALGEPPAVLSSVPLQVAANTSADPFRTTF